MSYCIILNLPDLTQPVPPLRLPHPRWLPEMQWLLRVVGVHQFMPANWLMDWIASEVPTLLKQNIFSQSHEPNLCKV